MKISKSPKMTPGETLKLRVESHLVNVDLDMREGRTIALSMIAAATFLATLYLYLTF